MLSHWMQTSATCDLVAERSFCCCRRAHSLPRVSVSTQDIAAVSCSASNVRNSSKCCLTRCFASSIAQPSNSCITVSELQNIPLSRWQSHILHLALVVRNERTYSMGCISHALHKLCHSLECRDDRPPDAFCLHLDQSWLQI